MIALIVSSTFKHGDMIIFFLSLAILIGMARALGELAEKFKQPPIIGEILAGIVLGPSVFGQISPALQQTLFPTDGPVHTGLQFISSLAIALFLLLAGMEIDLRSVWKQGKTALSISLGGMLLPFCLGLAVAFGAPHLIGHSQVSHKMAFALFFATALSISALPVIARILMDLKLIKSHLGVTVLTGAIVNDLIGWLIFAIVLGMIGASGSNHGIGFILLITVLFMAFMFTVGTKLIEKIFSWIQAHLSWPAGTLNFIIVGGLLCAAFTEWLGIHAIFGTFIFGVTVGQCPHIRKKTLYTLESFISFIITPIFFASIGLEVNFINSFDFGVVLIVLAIGTVGKIAGSWAGGKLAGMGNRESLAIGCAMNARGVMEIILGLIAYQTGLINESLFVALVVLALLTSMTSGALVQKILKRRSPLQLKKLLRRDMIEAAVPAGERDELIRFLSSKAVLTLPYSKEDIIELVLAREQLDSTGLDNGVAIPHCRVKGLKEAKVVLGICHDGVDFFSLDQSLSKVIFLILTPADDPQAQLEIIAQVATIFRNQEITNKFLKCKTNDEFIAFLNSH
ncbi:cation:proton antiporter [Lentisphaera marina]|uniref:cation:proton antiporter domain-containing protein n=1 Tax=Lentisphaera marina TaxID=1111041 RepID=UPI002366FF54|nr:cation:proton antiporter [Lentisphaera marina]MDD7984422.1 cation:proton antiporter [Lentisphaera marina]